MYIDLLEDIVKNSEKTNEILDNIYEHISNIEEKQPDTQANKNSNIGVPMDVVSIEKMVSSINNIDKEKSKSFIDIIKAIDEIEIKSSTSNVDALTKTIETLGNALTHADISKDKVDAANLLGDATKGLLGAAALIALASPLLVVSNIGALLLIPLMWSLDKAFSMLTPESIKNMENGSDAIKSVGWSILLFSGALALSAIIVTSTLTGNGALAMLAVFGFMALSALTFDIIGQYNDNINRGSLAVLGMTLSLLAFSYTLKLASDNVSGVGLANLGMLGLALGGTALLYALAGKFAQNILLGALSFAAIGLSLWLFSIPLETISDVIGKNQNVIWQLPLMLTAIGGVYALAGIPVVAGMMILGSIAFAAVGLSLIPLAMGLNKLSEVKDFDGDKFSNIIKGITQGFSEISLSDMLTIPLKIPAILTMSMALASLGFGMKTYKDSAGWTTKDADEFSYVISSFSSTFSNKDIDWDSVEDGIDATMDLGENLNDLAVGIKAWETINFDIDKVRENVSSILNTIPLIFAEIGKADEAGESFFGWGQGDVEKGISSTMDLGKNLTDLSDGIKSWETIKFDINRVRTNVAKVLGTIPFIFAELGRSDESGESFFGWGQGDVEKGISSTMELGNNLISLADGIKKWDTLDFDIEKVRTNVANVLGSLPSIFAQIGKADSETDSFFDWGGGDVEKGIDLVSSMTDPLDIVSTIIKNLSELNVDSPDKVGTMISSVFSGLENGLGMISMKSVLKLKMLVEPLSSFSDILPDFNENLEETINILNGLDSVTLDKFEKLAIAMDKLGSVKSLELQNKNISEVTQEVVTTTNGLNIPTESEPKSKQEESGKVQESEKSVDNTELLSAIKNLSSLLEKINGSISENSDSLEKIVSKLGKTLKVKNESF